MEHFVEPKSEKVLEMQEGRVTRTQNPGGRSCTGQVGVTMSVEVNNDRDGLKHVE